MFFFAEPLFSATPRLLLCALAAKLSSANPQEERQGSLRAALSAGRETRADVVFKFCSMPDTSVMNCL
jgi:hypothetical protein|uniref:Secreted protein n=1 Tax=Zea mays TaxID=4577 RepID=C0HHU8_MAIZE|nr:unknown [Zea mays]